jgi:hypothetical protein
MMEWALTHPFNQKPEAYIMQANAFAPWMTAATELWGRGLVFVDPNAAAIGQWERAKAKVQEISALENDWDGYGAAALGKAALANALHAIDIMASSGIPIPFPEVSPTAAGTVSLVWEFSATEACIEIGNTRYSGYVKIGAQTPAFLEGQADAIDAHVFWLIALAILLPHARTLTIANIRIRKNAGDVRLAS